MYIVEWRLRKKWVDWQADEQRFLFSGHTLATVSITIRPSTIPSRCISRITEELQSELFELTVRGKYIQINKQTQRARWREKQEF